MIDVKAAILAAKNFVLEVYSENEVKGLRLEEVEADGSGNWKITLGWLDPNIRENPLVSSLFTNPTSLPREYKTFLVDGATGQVKNMKLHETSTS
jgi:hypothetical protein